MKPNYPITEQALQMLLAILRLQAEKESDVPCRCVIKSPSERQYARELVRRELVRIFTYQGDNWFEVTDEGAKYAMDIVDTITPQSIYLEALHKIADKLSTISSKEMRAIAQAAIDRVAAL